MAAAAEPLLMTVEEYRRLPERQDIVQELHWGQVVHVTFPKMGHTKLQARLVMALQSKAVGKGVVAAEVPFRALPEYDLRRADVAFVSKERWDQAEEDLYGAPELVIEILSPSNTQVEMREKAALCLGSGAQEFWIVNAKRKSVTVMRRESGTLVYGEGQQIPLPLFGGELSVSEVFA